jgi:hypothetical protein
MTDRSPDAQIISLAAFREARQAATQASAQRAAANQAAATIAGTPHRFTWSLSKAGNWHTTDPRSKVHLVIYQNRKGWSGRATQADGKSGYVAKMPTEFADEAAAKRWSEGWLGEVAKFVAAQDAALAPPR